MNHRVSSVDSSPTVPSLEQQACGRPLPAFRMHVWTIELTQSLLCDPEPLMLPPLAAIYLPSCGFHMTILRKVEPPLQWPVVPVGPGYHDKYVGDPWYRFLAEGDFVHGDEVGSGYQETHLYSRCHRTHDATELPFGNDIIGVVDEVVFRHISPRSKRVVFKLMNLRLSELGIEIHSVLTRRSQWSSQASGSAQLSSRETFISKSEAKTISEINNLCEEFVYVTVGTITRIFMDNHSWCYAACIQCHKKTNVYTEPFV
ncbi:hypothetical protein JHK85_035792 [Glycine max]|nr:hypothetical protein JHK85_035792 [Glycine max]